MLDRQTTPPRPVSLAPREPLPRTFEIGLPEILAFLRRRRMPIILGTLLCLLAGLAYLVVTPNMYTAQSALLIDTRKLSIFNDGNVFEDSSLSTAAVETQVQLLRSGQIALKVVDLIGPAVASDPRLVGEQGGGITTTIRSFLSGIKAAILGPAEPPVVQGPQLSPEEIARQRAAAAIRANLKVTRADISYVINVSFTARDPNLAAQIVNATAEAYLEDQTAAQFTTAQRATNWLQQRIEELRRQSADESLSVRERNAVRATYDSFLQRYTQTVQQQSLPLTEARVITAAAPGYKSSPKTLLVLVGSLMLGSLAGASFGLARDLLDRRVRTPEQAEDIAGVPCLGLLPLFSVSRAARRNRKNIDPASRLLMADAAYSVGLDAPNSRFSETLRAARFAAEKAFGGPAGVLGIVSSVAGEGRSTVAANMARLIAQGGVRTLLIDGDIANPKLSETMTPAGTSGLVQVMAGQEEIGNVLWMDQATKLHFLPAGSTGSGVRTADLFRSPETASLLKALRQHYEFIVIDLPAVMQGVDVQASSALFDAFLFVIEWGSVTDDALLHAFRKEGIEERVVGTLLNKVPKAGRAGQV